MHQAVTENNRAGKLQVLEFSWKKKGRKKRKVCFAWGTDGCTTEDTVVTLDINGKKWIPRANDPCEFYWKKKYKTLVYKNTALSLRSDMDLGCESNAPLFGPKKKEIFHIFLFV